MYGLLLLELFQFLKEFWILLKLCSWFPWLISISASFRFRFIVHCQSSSHVTAKVLPWKTKWPKNTRHFVWNHLPYIKQDTLFQNPLTNTLAVFRWNHRYRVTAVTTNHIWFDRLNRSATKMVSFFCQKILFLVFSTFQCVDCIFSWDILIVGFIFCGLFAHQKRQSSILNTWNLPCWVTLKSTSNGYLKYILIYHW